MKPSEHELIQKALPRVSKGEAEQLRIQERSFKKDRLEALEFQKKGKKSWLAASAVKDILRQHVAGKSVDTIAIRMQLPISIVTKVIKEEVNSASGGY